MRCCNCMLGIRLRSFPATETRLPIYLLKKCTSSDISDLNNDWPAGTTRMLVVNAKTSQPSATLTLHLTAGPDTNPQSIQSAPISDVSTQSLT